MNNSVGTIKQTSNVNEYGYSLPSIGTKRFSTNDIVGIPKQTTSPRLHKKFISHNIDRETNSSYTKEEFKSIIAKVGTCTQVGFNPLNPLKMNQDSFVVTD